MAVAHAVRVGIVERSVFAVEDAKVDRRLLEATARTAGSQERAREDCVA